MTPRTLALLALLAGCDGSGLVVDDTDVDTQDSSPSFDSGDSADTADTDRHTGDTGPVDSAETDDTDPVDTGPDTSMYDDARLVVREPQSAGFYLIADGVPLDGEIQGHAGGVLPFRDIEWSVRGSGDPPFVGRKATIPDVPAGIYTIDVIADLPNGDRVSQVLSEVRVQNRLAGTWVGTARIDTSTTIQGTPVNSTCIGAIDFFVDVAGEVVDGGGSCSVTLGALGAITIDLDLAGTITDPTVAGDIQVGTPLLSSPLGWSGRFRGSANNRTMDGTFSGTVGTLQLDGTLDARQVGPWSPP